MKNLILTTLVSFFIINIKAQDTASLKVEVFNELNTPLIGEQIIFDAQDKLYKTKGVTNEEGMFFAKLVSGKIYDIKLKTIGEAKDYNTINIPKLEKGQSFAGSVLTITIYEPKTFTLDNVYFDSGKSTLKKESFAELNELYEYLSLKKGIKIQISGHTDNVGDEDANMKLSKDRAIAIKSFLMNKGIDAERLFIKSFGETQPIATNETSEGRKLNRRIEVLVL